jgi:hypothetical protein
MPKRPKLVTQFLENISRAVLEEHPELADAFVKRRNGIYALYNKGELYYAGLTSDLHWRLKHHLKDRHRDSWDSFSVYLTIGDKHLRELESLLIRVACPPGNRQKGRFAGAENLEKRFERAIDRQHEAAKCRLLGRPVEEPVSADDSVHATHLCAWYKGKRHDARLRRDGKIRHDRKVYSSLSAAASTICGHNTNGRWFWHFERSPGDWVRIMNR